MTDNVSQIPLNVDLDLDTVEKPPADQIEYFRVNVAGKTLEFANPEDLDWQDLMYLETPTDILREVLSADDYQHLRDSKLPGWKLGKLMQAFQRHYGIDEKFIRAQREQRSMGRL